MKSPVRVPIPAVTFAFFAVHASIALAQGSTPEICAEVHQPVCGTDPNGMRVTYPNACFARMAKATNVTPGECPK